MIAHVALTDEEISDAVLIVATTGMRSGELLGLRWSTLKLEQSRAELFMSRATLPMPNSPGDAKVEIDVSTTIKIPMFVRPNQWNGDASSKRLITNFSVGVGVGHMNRSERR